MHKVLLVKVEIKKICRDVVKGVTVYICNVFFI